MKLIDKDALVAEIERQQRKNCVLSQSNDVELRKNAAIQNGVYCSLLSLLDTLEVKEVDLEEYIENEVKHYGLSLYEASYGTFSASQIDRIIRNAFELGVKARQS